MPPRPTAPPTVGAKNLTKNVTRNGGGFNPSINPSLTLNIPSPKGGGGAGSTSAQGVATTGGSRGGSVPGADFMSNDDIRAFCEHLRKDARNRATERAMDADHLEAVLRTIPDATGNRSGSRARARRVSRWLKKIAAGEKNIQKYAAMVYGTFEREFEAELRTISKGRPKQNQRQPFNWR
ncbi:plasmid transfer protein TraA [Streptomyces noursei]|uniref:plasmid transfer protein TraA n=1 Tax=Streptomyces noursei TaxID=1971 RepID=UPI00227D8AED|nr:plasmid transfer protein TraA [Streptomyces noursei]MCZ1013972.1 plasmid transfer protein TraA [Streptomyces noursei]